LNHYRKFSEEEYNDVLKTFENTRKEVETRFTNFIEHEYFDQIWIGNFEEFEKIISIVKSHYNESRPHQSLKTGYPLK